MRGVVVCPEPRAAEIGADVLRAGGNAFDAAIAGAFGQMVFHPFMTGLGGWGMATIYHAATRTTRSFTFAARVGEKMREDLWANDITGYTKMWHVGLVRGHPNLAGYTSIMTPGIVAGLGELHARYGTKPWAELLQPSIEASDEGYEITEQIASMSRLFRFPGMPSVEDHYCWSPEAKRLWVGEDGKLVSAGTPFRNPEQARILETLAANGASDFYNGEIADIIIDDFEKNGAFVSAADLRNYKIDEADALSITYRGRRVESAAPPNGGLLVLHILKVLERFELSKMEHGGPEHSYTVGAALAWAGVVRYRYLADPKYQDIPVDWILSDAYSDEIADHIRKRELPTHDVLNEPGGTTHISVTDEQGNCVSLTHTLSMASGVVIPGTGFTWNGCACLMDPEPGRVNSMVPGRSRASAGSPTIVYNGDKPHIVVGSPGGYSVSSAVVQALVNFIDFGMSAYEATGAPRLHSEGNPVFVENRASQRTIAELRRLGMEIVQRPESYVGAFGRVQMAVVEDQVFKGAADPRADGGAAFIV